MPQRCERSINREPVRNRRLEDSTPDEPTGLLKAERPRPRLNLHEAGEGARPVVRKSLQGPREMSTFTAPEKDPPSGLETSRTFAELTRRTLRLADRRGESATAARVARARAE